MMRFPEQNELFEYNKISIDTPYKSLVNSNIYLVDNYFSDSKLEFIREHYYPDAQLEQVGTVNSFCIWKIVSSSENYIE